MPRKGKLRIGRLCVPREGQELPMRVEAVQVVRDEVHIRLRHLSEAFEGQVCEITRTQPVSPDGIVGGLLRACGQPVAEDSTVDPEVVVGMIVAARFGKGDAGRIEIVSFKQQELNHDKTE